MHEVAKYDEKCANKSHECSHQFTVENCSCFFCLCVSGVKLLQLKLN